MNTDALKRAGIVVAALAGTYVVGQVIALSQGKRVPDTLLPLGVYNSVILLGLVFACLTALLAVGLVLVYQASRIINFAAAGFGLVATTTFVAFYGQFGYFGAAFAALVAGTVTGMLTEVVVIRRFAKAPRLVLTIATLGILQVLGAVALTVPTFISSQLEQGDAGGLMPGGQQPSFGTPFSGYSFEIFPVVFTGDHIAIVVASLIALAGMFAFFRFSNVGVAIRGAAENDDRAALLGINVGTLSTVVWGMAAGLASVGSIMLVPVQGLAGAAGDAVGGNYRLLLIALAAAVIGGMRSLPITVAAVMGIYVLQQSVFWAFDDTSLVTVALLAVIVIALLVQRKRLQRTDEGITGTWAATEEVRNIPSELASFPVVKRGLVRFGLVIAAGLIAYPWVMSPSQTNMGSLFALYGIVAVSLVILTGWGGQISLGQFAFVAVGAVMGGAMTASWGVPFLAALILASLTGAGVAILLGLPALRIKGLYLAVTTLSFAIVVHAVFLNQRYFGWLLPDVIERPSFLWFDTSDERVFYYLTLVCLVGAVIAAEGIRRSRTGRVLIAMRENERAAQSFGVNLVRVRLSTFAISGFMAAFAGVLYGHHQHAIDANSFAPAQSIMIFLMAVIGGLGSVRGVLVGALYFGILQIAVAGGAGQFLASGMGVLLLLMFFPGGLGAMVYRIRDAWLRRIALRYKISVPSLLGGYRYIDGVYAKAKLAPLPGNGKAEVPVRYRIPESRVRTAGQSQQQSTWRL